LAKHEKRELSEAALAMIAERFKVLAEPMRLKILHALWDDERTVGEIIDAATGCRRTLEAPRRAASKPVSSAAGKKACARFTASPIPPFRALRSRLREPHDRLVAQMDEIQPRNVSRRRA